MTSRLPRVEGCGVAVSKGNIQAAIEEAGRRYRDRFGASPTHVSLPPGVDPAGVKLWTMNLGHHAAPGVVVVGRAVGRGNGQHILQPAATGLAQ